MVPITLATGWNNWWVNQQCNLDPEYVPQVLLYFPIVILIVAISLFLVEKFFNVAFKVGDEAKHFYELLVKLKVLDKKGKKKPLNIILGINSVMNSVMRSEATPSATPFFKLCQKNISTTHPELQL